MRIQISFAMMLVSILCGAVPVNGQTTRPAAAPARAADEQSFQAAIAAYDQTAKAMIAADYDALVRSLADNRRPIVAPEKQNDDAEIAKAAENLRKNEADIKKTAALTSAVERIRPQLADAMMEETEIRGKNVTLLKVPLKGSQKIAADHGINGRGGWTSDKDGNLVILMCKYGGRWYWNPFGW